jgi:hypothetical protein
MDLSSLPMSYWLGAGLILWLLYDLVTGSAYLHREFRSESEPMAYWLTMLLWSFVAASCFIYPHWS